MTREEKQKAIYALKISAPVRAMTQEEFNDYIQTINQIMDWLEQEPKTGHWIYSKAVNTSEIIWSECSECKDGERGCAKRMKYCPNCGCAMKGELE